MNQQMNETPQNESPQNEALRELLRQVKQDKKKAALARRLRRDAWKTSIAKEVLEKDNILLSYITDKFGFKKGVVIAIGPGQVGWSLVNKRDYEYQELGLEQIPALAGYIHNPEAYIALEPILEDEDDEDENGDPIELTAEDTTLSAAEALNLLITNPAFKAWAASGGVLRVPLFDRKAGIETALDRARLYNSIKPNQGLTFDEVPLPTDRDLRRALEYMVRRSHRYYKDHPNTGVTH